MDDLRIYERGDLIPDDWVSITPDGDNPDFRRGIAIFGCRTEASFRDGWLRLHAIEPGGPVLQFIGIDHASIHFLLDIRIFDMDGNPLCQLNYSEGTVIEIAGDFQFP